MALPVKTYRPDETPAVPVSALIHAFGQRDEEVARVLGPEGPIAASLPGYQPRPTQIRMAQEVARAFKLRKHAVIEAGTGTGKSLGYLIPSILSGNRVVISTATLALQDQLRKKDLPFLERHLGRPFRWAVLKGRTNYLCAANEEQPPLGYEAEMEQVLAWMNQTSTGDLGELPWDLKQAYYRPLKAVLAVQEDECPGRKCPFADNGECWFYTARDRALEAQVLVVNHALLILDLVLGGNLLPPYQAAVVDEAHQLEEYARGALERRMSNHRVTRILKQAARFEVKGEQQKETSAALFAAIAAHVQGMLRGGTGNARLHPRELPQNIPATALALWDQFGVMDEHLARRRVQMDEDDPECGRLDTLRRNVGQLRDDLKAFTEEQPHNVLWAEVLQPDRPPVVMLTPVDVAPFLRKHLFGKSPTVPVVLTSATLSTGSPGDAGAFKFVEEALGVEHPLELQVDSPYCYRRQALYYLPEIHPAALDRRKGERYEDAVARYADEIAPYIEEVLGYTEGRAFCLFTSYAVMDATRDRLRHLPWPSMSQGEASKQEIVRWFKEAPNPVLFATASFWEGVDIPGSQLSCVIIDKIPFPNSNHPVEAARHERFGRAAFHKLDLPRAITMLKQGVGRLIRQETDRGLLVLLDPRFRSKRYGMDILAALPGSPEPDKTTLDPSSLHLVGRFLSKVVPVR